MRLYAKGYTKLIYIIRFNNMNCFNNYSQNNTLNLYFFKKYYEILNILSKNER